MNRSSDRRHPIHPRFYRSQFPAIASLVAERLVGAVERLETMPRSGRIVPEFGDDRLREVILGSYTVVYQILDEAVEVLTIYHGARIFEDPRGS